MVKKSSTSDLQHVIIFVNSLADFGNYYKSIIEQN